jgi:sporulation protein YlmC with PRC-barrel domain
MDQIRQMLTSDDLQHRPVYNNVGDRIGRIEDFMLDMQSGCVAYSVLSFGGFMGIGDKLFAIPWKTMTFDQNREQWQLNVTREQLERAPGFDKNNWPDMTSDQYRNNIEQYWRDTAPGSSATAQSQMQAHQSSQSEREMAGVGTATRSSQQPGGMQQPGSDTRKTGGGDESGGGSPGV